MRNWRDRLPPLKAGDGAENEYWVRAFRWRRKKDGSVRHGFVLMLGKKPLEMYDLRMDADREMQARQERRRNKLSVGDAELLRDRIMAYMQGSPSGIATARDVARGINENPGKISRQMENLVKQGVLAKVVRKRNEPQKGDYSHAYFGGAGTRTVKYAEYALLQKEEESMSLGDHLKEGRRIGDLAKMAGNIASLQARLKELRTRTGVKSTEGNQFKAGEATAKADMKRHGAEYAAKVPRKTDHKDWVEGYLSALPLRVATEARRRLKEGTEVSHESKDRLERLIAMLSEARQVTLPSGAAAQIKADPLAYIGRAAMDAQVDLKGADSLADLLGRFDPPPPRAAMVDAADAAELVGKARAGAFKAKNILKDIVRALQARPTSM